MSVRPWDAMFCSERILLGQRDRSITLHLRTKSLSKRSPGVSAAAYAMHSFTYPKAKREAALLHLQQEVTNVPGETESGDRASLHMRVRRCECNELGLYRLYR